MNKKGQTVGQRAERRPIVSLKQPVMSGANSTASNQENVRVQEQLQMRNDNNARPNCTQREADLAAMVDELTRKNAELKRLLYERETEIASLLKEREVTEHHMRKMDERLGRTDNAIELEIEKRLKKRYAAKEKLFNDFVFEAGEMKTKIDDLERQIKELKVEREATRESADEMKDQLRVQEETMQSAMEQERKKMERDLAVEKEALLSQIRALEEQLAARDAGVPASEDQSLAPPPPLPPTGDTGARRSPAAEASISTSLSSDETENGNEHNTVATPSSPTHRVPPSSSARREFESGNNVPTAEGANDECASEVNNASSARCDNSEMEWLQLREQVKAEERSITKRLSKIKKGDFNDGQLVAVNTQVTGRIISIIKVLVDPSDPKLFDVPKLAQVFFKSLPEFLRCRRLMGKKMSSKGKDLLALPIINDNTRLGELVLNDGSADIEQEVEAGLARAKIALQRLDEYKTKTGRKKVLTDAMLESVLSLTEKFKFIISHVTNICVIVHILWNTTVDEILPRDGWAAMLHRLQGLASDMAAQGEVPLSLGDIREMKLLSFIQDIALPAFRREEATCMKSAALVCEIILRLTTGGRSETISSKWVAADQCTISALCQISSRNGSGTAANDGVASQDAGGDKTQGALASNRDARKRICTTFCATLLGEPLRRRFPEWEFLRGDYISNLLFKSPTKIMNGFRFLNVSLFTEDANEQYAIISGTKMKAIKAAELKKMITQTLIFGNKEQVDNMLKLYSKW